MTSNSSGSSHRAAYLCSDSLTVLLYHLPWNLYLPACFPSFWKMAVLMLLRLRVLVASLDMDWTEPL